MTHKNHFIISCLGSLALLTFAACADDDLGNGSDGDKDTHVSFIVSQAQDNAQDNTPDGHNAQAATVKAMPGTRALFAHQLALQGLTPEDLTAQKLPVQGTTDMCLIETTTAGIDHSTQNRANAATRANVKGEGTNVFAATDKFATIGYRGATATTLSTTPWFYDQETNHDGTLVSPIRWSWGQPYGKFYGIYPRHADYAKLTLSPQSHPSTPYVDFEVDPNVKKQTDLMTAYSGMVQYATRFVAPTTNLKFHHALTAVRFKVGQNLSYSRHITKVEIVNAASKGRYTLPTTAGDKGTWDTPNTPATFTLGGDGTVNVSTTAAVNQIIMGNNGDNYTFYMIPQSLSGVSVKIYFDNSPTPAITANLTGTWKPGTTKTYALSQNNSDWQYVLNVTGPTAPVAYDQTAAGNYTIQSYRKDPATNTLQPVKWKVVGYQESADGGSTWSTLSDTKPAWLTSLSLTSGNGVTSGSESGAATVQKAPVVDKLAAYNKVLHDATPKGSAGSYYDLSTHDYKGNPTNRNTANSYLISAPGYYKIPLVYGNAITGGNPNPDSYISSAPVTPYNEPYGNASDVIFHHFKDHAGQDITDPWITQTNGGANKPNGAKIVWSDQSGIVEVSSIAISSDGQYIQFHVPQDKIKNGNAVIAVTKGGTVVWSWHLWFDHDDVLNILPPITNFQNKTYSFTKQTLGFAYRKWEVSTYTQPRVARIKVEQTMSNGGVKQFGYIDITQNPGSIKKISSTFYQFGRKDAIPGTDAIADGSFNKNAGDNMSIQNGIQHPENFYTSGSSWNNYPPAGCSYLNLWSANDTETSNWFNDNPVVKTVYDPCPAGLKMPASNAFTGFTTTGQNTSNSSEFNVEGSWDMGYTFKSKTGINTVFFPATGCRLDNNGLLLGDEIFYGLYRTATRYDTNTTIGLEGSCSLSLSLAEGVMPKSGGSPAYGFAVRPVAE